jgi:N-acetyl sugar amidotransferase
MEIKYCKECVQPDTRPGIKFDSKGVCGPCNYYKTLKNVNWNQRRKQLDKHVAWCKDRTTDEGYDCIISVSGGKDSTRQAMIAKEFGLNPLLVSTVNPPEMQSDIGVSNLDNLMKLGFDIITVEPDPIVFKKLMKKAFIKYGNYGKSTELTLYASAPRLALAYGIKMIFLGENNSLVYGEEIECEDGGDASDMVNYNTLGGGGVEWMTDKENETLYENLFPYQYPNKKALKDNGIKIVYLGYYIEDFNNISNGKIAIKNGLSVRNVPQEYTGCVHNFDALDEDFVHINQMIKYFKFGFGKATDEVCELIRMGIKTRKEGLKIVQRLDGMCHDSYIDIFCKYLEISENEFWNIANKYRNRGLWRKVDNNWSLKHKVGGQF